ncbi:hypothetical protein BU14_0446s0005 [Porphyra umbilicalis]|uniref:Uncharacterized protein n=1 Tax=Porphyra umbilicalis TaxID=2786 RepID=A0A1X6NM52_PORUM|nr:hypothetical protein BU14_1289s0002 [Porphyra umbilicalis]OSX72310.1 hypothetical protein BU14_0446s0005 [Porphyra umbilicalis]|eukprot:OSX69667.1 hypothetical protein BU14_1289s0002 [Porphyra umbilicalis]
MIRHSRIVGMSSLSCICSYFVAISCAASADRFVV